MHINRAPYNDIYNACAYGEQHRHVPTARLATDDHYAYPSHSSINYDPKLSVIHLRALVLLCKLVCNASLRVPLACALLIGGALLWGSRAPPGLYRSRLVRGDLSDDREKLPSINTLTRARPTGIHYNTYTVRRYTRTYIIILSNTSWMSVCVYT